MKDGMKGACEEMLGYWKKVREDWIGNLTWNLIKERKCMHQKHLGNYTNQLADYQVCIIKDWGGQVQSAERQAMLARKAG